MALLVKFCLLALMAFAFATVNAGDLPSNKTSGPYFEASSHILFLAYKGHITEALEAYQLHKKRCSCHDFTLLAKLAQAIILQEWTHSSLERKIMALFGGAITLNENARALLEEALNTNYPELQFVALHLIANFSDDEADSAIWRALSSEYLPIRCEAAVYLAEKQHAKATAQLDALYYRLPKELHVLFPAFYMASGDDAAMRALRRLLTHPISEVRVEAIHALAQGERDDFLPVIKTLSHQQDIAVQEACCYALGKLHDSSSLPRLSILTNSNQRAVAVASAMACYHLGKLEAKELVISYAKKHDPFAIYALGDIEESKELLAKLCSSNDKQIKLNATLALLKLRDNRCVPKLLEIFSWEEKGLNIAELQTVGKALKSWKLKAYEHDKELAEKEKMQQHLLCDAIILQVASISEEIFLSFAEEIFKNQYSELSPSTCKILEKSRSPAALLLLKQSQNQFGCPLIRAWCSLALFRTQADSASEAHLLAWLHANKDELITFSSLQALQGKTTKQATFYELTAKEKCRLYIEILEAFSEAHSEKGVETLLYMLQHGPCPNRAFFAGLLLHALQ